MAKDKDFVNVVSLSRDWEEHKQSVLEEIDNPAHSRTSRVHLKMLLSQVQVQLAIAQQLTMIAKHLGEIVAKSKEGNGE